MDYEFLGGNLALDFTNTLHSHGMSDPGEDLKIAADLVESEDDLPLDPDLATVLLNWKRQCPDSVEGWVFPSKITGRCYQHSRGADGWHLLSGR